MLTNTIAMDSNRGALDPMAAYYYGELPKLNF